MKLKIKLIVPLVLIAALFTACDKDEFKPKSIGNYPDTLFIDYHLGGLNNYHDCLYPYKVISLNVTADNAIGYRWIDNNSTQPLRNISEEGYYYIEIDYGVIMDTLGFSMSTCSPQIYVPTSFTPNGDGTNEYWFPVWKNIEAMHWEIRTKDGIRIFETDDPYDKWDGRLSNGNSAPAGYYMYYINYSTLTETNIILTGHIEKI